MCRAREQNIWSERFQIERMRRWEWKKLLRGRWKVYRGRAGRTRRGVRKWAWKRTMLRTLQVQDVSNSLSKETSGIISQPYYIILDFLELVLWVWTQSCYHLQKEKVRSHWWSTREKDKSLKDCQLLWGTVSKSSRGRERGLEMRCGGGPVTAWTHEMD